MRDGTLKLAKENLRMAELQLAYARQNVHTWEREVQLSRAALELHKHFKTRARLDTARKGGQMPKGKKPKPMGGGKKGGKGKPC